jgi:MFS transporter, ACS family, D-galactonate transporter
MSDVHSGKATKMRWFIVVLAFFAILTNYMDRANLAIALPYMNGELHLTSGESGLILGAFFWTYALFQVPAGILVDRLGSRVVFAGAVVWWSLFTMATTIARGTFSLLGIRLLLGVGEAGAFPAATKLVERWFPATERGLASGIYDCGARGGTLIAIPLCSAVIHTWGWRASFIVTGAIGLVWVIVWLFVATEYPAQNKRTNQAEVRLIGNVDASGPRGEQAKINWLNLLGSRMVWAMAIGFACQGYVIYFFITWYPTYLVKERGFSLLQLGVFGILPGLAGLVGSWFGGWLSDRIARSSFGLNAGRKFCIVLGMAMSAVIGFAGMASQDWLALILLSVSFFGVSVATSSILALPADISPKGNASVAGTVAGFQNCIGNLAGIASPAVIGYLRDVTGSFTSGLVSASAVAIVGCFIYIFLVGTIKEGALDSVVRAQSSTASRA